MKTKEKKLQKVVALFKSAATEHFMFLSVMSYAFGYIYYIYDYVKSGIFNNLDWKLTQYHVSIVELGFVKRGVIGTFFSPVFDIIGADRAYKIFLIIIFDISVFIVFAYLIHKLLIKARIGQIEWVFRTLILLSPVGLMQWSFDLGRYDHIAFLLIYLAGHYIILKRYLYSGLIFSLAVFVHEASAIYGFASLLFLGSAQEMRGKNSIRSYSFLFSLFPGILVLVLVYFWGNVESEENLAKLLSYDGKGAVVWSRGAFELALDLSFLQYSICFIYFTAMVVFFYKFLICEVNNIIFFIFIASISSLYVLGIDYFRWLNIIFVVFILTFLQHRASLTVREDLRLGYEQALSACILIAPLGPIGISSGLPYVKKLLT